MMRRLLTPSALAVIVTACVADAEPRLEVSISAVASPAGEGSGEPFLSSTGDAVVLSWLEANPDGGHDLRFATSDGSSWSEASVIATSERFFVNWADFPSVTADGAGTLWAHWLERGSEGGYDYGVRVVSSSDGGRHWTEPWTPHSDDSPTEHGFVSALPMAGGMGFAWLDGRNFASSVEGGEPTREMTLRFRTISADGTAGAETLIDGRVCDCCQTDAAMSASGAVVVYRDRSDAEYRDIFLARHVDGAWTEGSAVAADGWKTYACPVNGPAVAASADVVAVAWFTAPDDVPNVKVAFSTDAGASFDAPIVVDDGSPAGRVDVLMLDGRSALVSWLERTGGEGAEVRARRIDSDGAMTGSVTLTKSSAERAGGFPRMIDAPDGSILLAWTDVADETPRVRLTRIEMEGS